MCRRASNNSDAPVVSLTPIERQSIAISVSICLFVCLFACLLACGLSVCLSARISQIPHVQISWNFTYIFCGCDSVLLWRQCDILYTSGFVVDVMFSHNRANGRESETTRMFRRVRQLAAPVGRQTMLLGRVHQGGGTGGEVCRLWLHPV